MKNLIRMRAALILIVLLIPLALFATPSFATVLANITPSPEPATATPIVPTATRTPVVLPSTPSPTVAVPSTPTPTVAVPDTPTAVPPSATPTAKKHRTDLDTPTPTASEVPTDPPTAVPSEPPTLVPNGSPTPTPAQLVPVVRPRPVPARLPRTGADTDTTSTDISWFLLCAIMLVIGGYLISKSSWLARGRR